MTLRPCLLLPVVLDLVLRGQAQPPSLKATATGVVVDVSVLDRNGQPVLDLVPGDFELTEDGAKQQILSATLIRAVVAKPAESVSLKSRASEPPTPAAEIAPNAGERAETATVTAILFDRLSPDSRLVAYHAALAYVATLSPPREYAGIFMADLAFRTFQPFTNQPHLLRSALNRFAQTAPNNLSADAEKGRTRPHTEGMDPSVPLTAGAESGAGFTTVADREKRLRAGAGDPSEMRLTQMELRMEEGYTRFLTEYEGDTSLSALRATVDSLALQPGRKSIVFFNESLPLTARLKAPFDALIGRANRANITIYPVDAAGLRVHSKEAEVNRNLALAGAQGVGDAQRPDGAWTKDLEKQEQMLSSRPTAVLGRLGKETGGFLLENTNDLSAGVARMQMERTTYYLLGYQPTNTKLDGSYRRVSVKVRRPKVTVRARSGYLAATGQP
jgi:VWFA-related protein